MRTNKNIYPAVPLITCDPYFNIWSMADKLNGDFPRHWTGMQNPLTGIIKIDGVKKVFMGREKHNPYYHESPYFLLKIEQIDLKVTPLKTIYTFRDESVELEVCFTTPLLPDDLKLLSRPVSYMSYKVKSIDGKSHDISVYTDASAMIAVDTADGTVESGRENDFVYFSSGTEEMLKNSGDDRRISWGRVCIGSPEAKLGMSVQGDIIMHDIQELPENVTVKVSDNYPVIYAEKEFGTVTEAEGFVCFGYDDFYSLEYFGKKIKGYWAKDGETFNDVFKDALFNYEKIMTRVDEFDEKLISDAEKISKDYAKITAISYRQVIGAHKLAWDGETGIFVSKECYSNGCAATVDVTYPSIPMFLVYNPDLVEYMLNPIFKLIEEGKWPFDFAPHDAGQYPLVNGQVYGLEGDQLKLEFQMPVEECGNMLICVAALCRKKGNMEYACKHFDILNKWADYLAEFGYNPENQLCTDDFAGHLAHNCNLSVKAIMGMASWGMILDTMGKENKYTEIAKEYASRWKKDAFSKDHYMLAFGNDESWSMKYNLVWDKLFGLGIFDKDIFETEVEYYKTKINKYGLPLDSRSAYTKSDWQMWTTVLTDDAEYTDMIVSAMLKMLAEAPNRVPFTDWYYTDTARQCSFQNRTVQGGLYIKMLNI